MNETEQVIEKIRDAAYPERKFCYHNLYFTWDKEMKKWLFMTLACDQEK